MALVAEDNTMFSKEAPLIIGMKTEDTILEVLKEGEIKMLDSVWKRVKNNQPLSNLWEEVGMQEAMVQVTKATGQELLKLGNGGSSQTGQASQHNTDRDHSTLIQ